MNFEDKSIYSHLMNEQSKPQEDDHEKTQDKKIKKCMNFMKCHNKGIIFMLIIIILIILFMSYFDENKQQINNDGQAMEFAFSR